MNIIRKRYIKDNLEQVLVAEQIPKKPKSFTTTTKEVYFGNFQLSKCFATRRKGAKCFSEMDNMTIEKTK